MICPKCNNEGVPNTANGKSFYYCRTCKDEIMLTQAEPEQDPYDFFFQDRSVTSQPLKFKVGDLVRCVNPRLAGGFLQPLRLNNFYRVTATVRGNIDITDGVFHWSDVSPDGFELVRSSGSSSPATTSPPPSVWMTSFPGNWMSNPELKAQWLADKDWS